jgi:hypothetical protein
VSIEQSIVIDIPEGLRTSLALIDEEAPGEFTDCSDALLSGRRLNLAEARAILRRARSNTAELEARVSAYEQIEELLEVELARADEERGKYEAAMGKVLAC